MASNDWPRCERCGRTRHEGLSVCLGQSLCHDCVVQALDTNQELRGRIRVLERVDDERTRLIKRELAGAEQRGYERGRREERAEILAMVRNAIREGVKPDLLDPAIQAVAQTAPNGVRAYAASTLAVLAEDIHERGEHAGEETTCE